MKDSTYYLIALNLVDSIGQKAIDLLLGGFKNPSEIFHASEDDLVSCGLRPSQAKRIKGFSRWKRVEQVFSICQKKGIKIIDIFSDNYPQRLREIASPPPLLFLRGELEREDWLSIAVVGSRRPSAYGITVAEQLTGELASLGLTIVSGMARGIDSVAHKEALKAGGRTIAVLGSGVDVVYPAENRSLMERIAVSGAVISEFLPGTRPERGNFPRRNRIISGLSLGVLVVEATTKSGTLITAGYAIEQGRDVFAVPGRVNSSLSAGTNELIKKGAKLVLTVEDIVEEFAHEIRQFLKQKSKPKRVELTPEEEALLRHITDEPVHVDELTRTSGLPLYKILSILTGLEIKGMVRQTEGKRFCRKKEVQQGV